MARESAKGRTNHRLLCRLSAVVFLQRLLECGNAGRNRSGGYCFTREDLVSFHTVEALVDVIILIEGNPFPETSREIFAAQSVLAIGIGDNVRVRQFSLLLFGY